MTLADMSCTITTLIRIALREKKSFLWPAASSAEKLVISSSPSKCKRIVGENGGTKVY